MMDTYVTIQSPGPAVKADAAIDAAFVRLEEISRKFNHLDSASPVWAFNEHDEPITDTEVIYVLKQAQYISELSGGAFDITVEPLVRLWGFYGSTQAVPAQRQIDSCLRSVGYRNLVVGPDRVTKTNPEARIDLGGIAKGFGLAEAARVLREKGVDSALIDLGGDVYAIGKKGDEQWKVGIRSPRNEGVVGVLAVRNLAAVTSGDYERFFQGPDSVRYCHILNPHTGWPARGVASATVLSRDPVLAQGLSKVLFILGPEAMKLSDSANHFEALLINDSLKATMSAGLAGILKFESPDSPAPAGRKKSGP
jgi:thiamine biosynthesis lipoprotein